MNRLLNNLLLRLALPPLMAILATELPDILKREIKIPTDQRRTLGKLGISNEKLDAIDGRVSAQVAERVLREIERAVTKAVTELPTDASVKAVQL